MKFFFLAAGLAGTLIGCDPRMAGDGVVIATKKAVAYDWSVAQTYGNATFVPLKIGGIYMEHMDMITGVLDAFRKKNEDLEILSWNVDQRYAAENSSNSIYGIWIHHRPRRP